LLDTTLAVAIIAAIAASAYPQTAGSPAASAPGQSPELCVATMVFPPFVMEQNGSLTGFSIELWNAIAARLKLKTRYRIMRPLARSRMRCDPKAPTAPWRRSS